ncbi:MAG: TlpA family protein disulfide reductase [Mucilaginibacter sp.]|nr:TlpA family protein disulfide reductase [Mucilaginibacter sp.]
MDKKKRLSYIYNGLFIAALLIILFVPAVKITLIQGLMKIGLFRPDVVKTQTNVALPSLTLEYPDGRKAELQNLKGKVVFMNFWATWCPPCIAEMPSINELQQQLKADTNIVFLMIDADHDFNKSVPFMQKHGFSLPLVQVNSYVPDQILNNTLPTTAIFDKNGKMVFHHEGMADYGNDKIADYIKGLAKAK